MEDKVELIGSSILKELQQIKLMQIEDKELNIIHTVCHCEKHGITGVGSDFNSELSIIKARSEIIERFIYSQSKRILNSTSGLAVHSTISGAKENALKELIERDLFLTSWFSGKYPDWTSPIVTKFPFKRINGRFEVSIGHIGTCLDYQCYVYILSDRNNLFGAICGAVCEKRIEDSISKILFDISRIQLIAKDFKKKGSNFFKKKQFKASDHLEFYAAMLKDNYINDYYTKISGEAIKLSLDKYSFINFKSDKCSPYSIIASYCSSPETQNYFTGPASRKKINKLRITNPIPEVRLIHPLG